MRTRPDKSVSARFPGRFHAGLMAFAILAGAVFAVLHRNGYRLWAFSAGGSQSVLLTIQRRSASVHA